MLIAANTITVYTDGSCHTQLRIGGWAALLFIETKKIVLTGTATDTTHNRMELVAVIEAINYIRHNVKDAHHVHICSDSQYVVGLVERKQKLSAKNFITKKGTEIQNADLMQELWRSQEGMNISFEKVKAHQRQTEIVNPNIEADKLSRQIVRDAVKVYSVAQQSL